MKPCCAVTGTGRMSFVPSAERPICVSFVNFTGAQFTEDAVMSALLQTLTPSSICPFTICTVIAFAA